MIQSISRFYCDVGFTSGQTIRTSIDPGSGTTKKEYVSNRGSGAKCAVNAPVATERRVLRITNQYSSRNNETMADARLRADLEALALHLAQAEHALVDTRRQVDSTPKATTARSWTPQQHRRSTDIHWRAQELARVVIPIHHVHGICQSQLD